MPDSRTQSYPPTPGDPWVEDFLATHASGVPGSIGDRFRTGLENALGLPDSRLSIDDLWMRFIVSSGNAFVGMNPAHYPSLPPSGGGGPPAAWSPLSLFAPGVLGAWYDPSDLSTVRANTDGTGDVAVGEGVRYLGDKSGNGNHLTQTLSTTSFWPVLRQDAGGRYYLEFNGTSRFMRRDSFNLGGKNRMNAVCAILKEAVNVNSGEVFAYNASDNPSFRLEATSNFLRAHHTGSTTGRQATTPPDYPTPGGPYVVASIHDRQTPLLRVRVNKGANTDVTTAAGTNNFTSQALRLGARTDFPSAPFRGGVYGLVIWSDDPTGMSDAEDFMAEKAGVTL